MFLVDKRWVESLPIVSNHELFKRGIPTRDGLLSEQIFGPLHDFTCQCGKFWGREQNRRCPNCDVPITTSRMRALQFARIKLVRPILNPLLELLVNKQIRDIAEGKHRLIIENGELVVEEGAQPHFEAAEILKASLPEEVHDIILLTDIIVLPPAFRPATKGWADDITKCYQQILAINKDLPIFPIELERLLYISVKRLYSVLIDRIGGKTGVIRRQCLGRELDLTGRAVVVPDPKLKVNEIGIPKSFLETWGIDIDRVLVNRQPTLHRRSMLAMKAVPVDDKVIKAPPAVHEGFNLDHDGDSVLGDVTIEVDGKPITTCISKLIDLEV